MQNASEHRVPLGQKRTGLGQPSGPSRTGIGVALGSLIALSVVAPWMTGCSASSQTQVRREPPRLVPLAEADVRLETGRAFYLIGQPSGAALREFSDRGGVTVVNLRSDGELEYLPFYGEQVADSCGLGYNHIPLTSSTFSPEMYKQFEAAISNSEGPVLLHCASGGRARAMYAVHAANSLGYDADRAIGMVTEESPPPEWLVRAVYLGLGLTPPTGEG